MAIYNVDGRPRNGKTFYVVAHLPNWLFQAKESGRRIYSNIKLFPENLPQKTINRLYPETPEKPWNFEFREVEHTDAQGKKYITKYTQIEGDISSQKDRENPDIKILYWQNIDEWNLMTSGWIIADEAQRYFNARNWMHLSEETEIKLQQHGKDNLDIWMTVQHFSRLDVTLRILIERFFHIEMIKGDPDNEKSKRFFGLLPKVSEIKEYYLEDMVKAERQGYDVYDEEENPGGIEPIDSWTIDLRPNMFTWYDTYQKVGRSRPMPLKHLQRICPDCRETKITHS